VLEQEFGYVVPKALAMEVSREVQHEAERTEGEVRPADILAIFQRDFIERRAPLEVLSYGGRAEAGTEYHSFAIKHRGEKRVVEGRGNGPIDAFVGALNASLGMSIDVLDFSQHALGAGEDARSVAYVQAEIAGRRVFGVGVHASIVMASLEAIASALNRA